MSQREYVYEIYLDSPRLDVDIWQSFCFHIAKLLGPLARPRLVVSLVDQTFHFYLVTRHFLPSGIGLSDFMLELVDVPNLSLRVQSVHGICLRWQSEDILSLANKFHCQSRRFISLELHFCSAAPLLYPFSITYTGCQGTRTCRFISPSLSRLLAVDFTRFPNYSYKKFPKYLSCKKVTPYLSTLERSASAILRVNAFPFAVGKSSLDLTSFDFCKHTLVLGSSGSGKSRFLSLFIDRLHRNCIDSTRVVVIDPHDNLYRDLTTVPDQQIYNFSCREQSVDLFQNPVENTGVAVELLLDLFRDLMQDHYNSRLERVLRFSSQLLLLHHNFSFAHLRQLLLDLEYRNQLLRHPSLPANLSEFFLTDFNHLKTQSYDLAIAPIIAFLDEAGIIPALNSTDLLVTFSEALQRHFLSVFSLNQLLLGHKMSRTIAGLLMQQIFLLAKSETLPQNLIVIIDEVAVVEHPILQNFLSELRKYHVTVILAGQYLGQLTPALREAIFANVANYFVFRVSRQDAELLTHNLDLPLENGKSDDIVKFLAGLNHRECVTRLSFGEKLQPAFKAETLDFLPPPYTSSNLPSAESTSQTSIETPEFQFSLETSTSLIDLMRENTTNRKILKEQNHDRISNS